MIGRRTETAVLAGGSRRKSKELPIPPRGGPATRFLDALAEPAGYLRCIERLAGLPAWRQDGLHASADEQSELMALFEEGPAIARALAHEVSTGLWRPRPARLSWARLDKPRLLHKLDPLDLVVHGAIAAALGEQVVARLSPCVHSYQRGRSALLAQRAFARFLRQHARARPEPRRRGLFLLRRDVRAFGDSVALGGRAPLWAQLRALLEPDAAEAGARAMELLEQVIRPPVLEREGEARRLFGLPTGSPINPVCTNLHLMPLDALGEIPGGFYARFGDDLLFAHPDASAAREASRRLDAELRLLGLRAHEGKRRDLWLNGAGRPSPEPGFTSARAVPFLGLEIGFGGNLRLPAEKVARLFEELAARLRSAARLAREGDGPGEEGSLGEEGSFLNESKLPGRSNFLKGSNFPKDGSLREESELRLLCGVAADALRAGGPFALPGALELREEVDDRGQLRDLELRAARLVIRVASGARSARALRELPPRRLRALGLPGLVAARSEAR